MRTRYVIVASVCVALISCGVIGALWVRSAKSRSQHLLSAVSQHSVPVIFAPKSVNVSKTQVHDVASTGAAIPHLYSPLREPPPVATSDNVKKWNHDLIARVTGWLDPDLDSAPVASVYDELTKRARRGDSSAALQLYVDLSTCNDEASPGSEQRTDQEIAQDEASHHASWADQVRKTVAFCTGLTQT